VWSHLRALPPHSLHEKCTRIALVLELSYALEMALA
jgi:hypothetical protein